MDEDHEHHRFKIELTHGKFIPSSTPEYHITFHFKFEIKISEFTVNQGSETLTRHTNETINDSARVVFKFHSSETTLREVAKLFASDTSESISTILACLPIRVSDDERRTLIDFAIKEAGLAVRNSMHDVYEAVDLHILVRMEGREVVLDVPFDEGSECRCMVPAADSSVRLLLKRCKIGPDHDSCCCICREEMGERGGADVALLSMPCQHVFHGDCIEKWLSISHYCPLCRFEMPTEEKDFWVINEFEQNYC